MKIKIKKIKNADLKSYSTIKIGKTADIYFPCNFRQLKYITDLFNKKKINYLILGNGSNILFSDNFKGKIVCMRDFSYIFLENNKIVCGAGVNLFKLCNFCAENDLGGLEFLYGIPGSVGGAIAMNAGAFGGEVCNFVERIVTLRDGEIIERSKLDYSYRRGPLQENEILLEATFNLNKCDKNTILEKQSEFFSKRKATQPYSLPSLGSVFKRGKNVVPAQLIDEWGLKGLRVGGAMISEKHAGFIVNIGSASAKDVLTLIEIVEKVAKNHNYCFEKEIKIV